MRIGELAKQVGASADTVRYYESIGLLARPARTGSGYRSYLPEDREQMGFILKARRLGLSLDEIRSVLGLHADGHVVCDRVIDILSEKLSTVATVLQNLSVFRAEIQRVRDWAVANHEELPGISRICAIIEESGAATDEETLRIVALHRTRGNGRSANKGS